MLKDKRDKVIIGLFIYQGVKKEEIEKLVLTDLKLREGKIEIPGGRRSNSRELPLEAHQVIELYDYMQQVRPQIAGKRDTGEKLFPTLKRGAIIHGRPLLLALQKINPKLKDLNQIRASVIIKWLRI